MAFPQFEVNSTTSALDIARAISGTSGGDLFHITVTDTSTSGTNTGICLDYNGSGTKTGANIYGLQVNMDEIGAGMNEYSNLLLTKSNTNQATVDTFISCKEWGTSVRSTSLLRWRGSDAPTYLFEISGAAQGGCYTSRATAYATILGTIKVFIEADANKAAYINVYSGA